VFIVGEPARKTIFFSQEPGGVMKTKEFVFEMRILKKLQVLLVDMVTSEVPEMDFLDEI
jgi:hypothetical protein